MKQTNEKTTQNTKKEYHRPSLKRAGTLATLTQGGTSPGFDNDFTEGRPIGT